MDLKKKKKTMKKCVVGSCEVESRKKKKEWGFVVVCASIVKEKKQQCLWMCVVSMVGSLEISGS